MRYRITYHRDDMPDHSVDEFEAEDDDAAMVKFAEAVADLHHAWDNMTLDHVIVTEKTRRVTINENMRKYLAR